MGRSCSENGRNALEIRPNRNDLYMILSHFPPEENSHGRAGNRTQDLLINSQVENKIKIDKTKTKVIKVNLIIYYSTVHKNGGTGRHSQA